MAETQRFVRADGADSQTRRVIQRLAANIHAVWIADNGHKHCRLVDVAPTGARLKVRNPDEMPDIFRLYVPDFQMLYEVETRWRREGHIGVMFLRAWREER
ncbi:MAG: PilZ domain-containing protein [Pseudomonadota bacterium]